ncbi:MAG: lipocalin family protein [Polaribacter sp.]|uniref:lipocalin family protein n=1 Tax=Polaribacter sp. TaxID=1920175 RepID=UPI00384EB434
MKTMKNFMYLCIAFTLLTSCTPDEVLDPIVGKWQLDSRTVNGIEQTTECERNTTLEFFEDGTADEESFYLDGVDCLSDTDTSTWENLSGTYRVDNDAESDQTLNFSQNNTVFSFTMTEITNGITYEFKGIFRKL